MKIEVQLQPASGVRADVAYRWDPDTDILSAQLTPRGVGEGMSGSVGLEGRDGSWVILDVAAGHIDGVEVAVWPDVREIPVLTPPPAIEDARVVLAAPGSHAETSSLEMATHVTVESDQAQRNFHFRLGKPRTARTVRLARDLLVDVDANSHLSGLWLLNVPPCPSEL